LLAYADQGARRNHAKHIPGSASQLRCLQVQIRARDGTMLNTYVALPSQTPTHKIPVIMERTPYDASKLEPSSAAWVSRGYACVWQDMRGRFASKGNFSFWRYSATDAADTIAWVSRCFVRKRRPNPWRSTNLDICVAMGHAFLHTLALPI
jgi:predicted acyl esterase